MIAIIDYGAGNIRSIEKALEHVGAVVQVTENPAVVAQAQAVVLPGVGSGGAAMARMMQQGLDDAIRQATEQEKPFLGICLGMQLLADHHAEGEVDGLSLFPGEVRRSRTWAGTRRHRCTATYPSSPVLQLTLISISPTRIMSSHETSKGWQQSPITAHPFAALS